ncbi:hypothetical protein Pelo_17322 [Pelomyxa schiedti]|nr:hypothetical protein Pelo_17322 [Pelomyxa schiedti]
MKATTANSQVMAVCGAAIVGRRTTGCNCGGVTATGEEAQRSSTIIGPCPSMTEWARSPALVRQWADDWVLPPLWEAVFRLPIKGTTRETRYQHKYMCVGVSLTLGVVNLSVFTFDSELGERVCGCIGDNRVLVAHSKDFDGVGHNREYFMWDTITQKAVGCAPDTSLGQWAPVSSPQCNRKWIVGRHDDARDSFLYIHKVSRGAPTGADVVVKCSGGLPVDEVTLLGDTVMIHGNDSSENEVVAFVDLEETFGNKKELVFTSKIDCGPLHGALATAAVTWLPDGSACILKRNLMSTTVYRPCYTLVDASPGHSAIWVFPPNDFVKPLSKDHLFSRSSKWSDVTRFQCDTQTGLILSTSHSNCGPETSAFSTEVEFSLHHGVTGFHFGGFVVPFPSVFAFKPYP